MLLLASMNGRIGLSAAMEILRRGGTAVEAVEAGIRCVEANVEESSVGLGGTPNLLGEVELDASIMDGATLQAGAVAALRGYAHPISIARQVMERLPFLFLVGEGAEIFAAECGFERRNLLTEERRLDWQRQLAQVLTPPQIAELARRRGTLVATQALVEDIKRGHGTTNLIAVDTQGRIASGVSTSGLGLKHPGRVGDSPIIGAGNYADNRYGAAVCTGYGEMAIRAGTARSVVLYMKMGLSVQDAAAEAIRDLRTLDLPWPGRMNVIAVDRQGLHCGASTRPNDEYLYMTEDMVTPVAAPRLHLSLEG